MISEIDLRFTPGFSIIFVFNFNFSVIKSSLYFLCRVSILGDC